MVYGSDGSGSRLGWMVVSGIWVGGGLSLHTGESVWLSFTLKQKVITLEHSPASLTHEVSAVVDGITRGDGCRWNL